MASPGAGTVPLVSAHFRSLLGRIACIAQMRPIAWHVVRSVARTVCMSVSVCCENGWTDRRVVYVSFTLTKRTGRVLDVDARWRYPTNTIEGAERYGDAAYIMLLWPLVIFIYYLFVHLFKQQRPFGIFQIAADNVQLAVKMLNKVMKTETSKFVKLTLHNLNK